MFQIWVDVCTKEDYFVNHFMNMRAIKPMKELLLKRKHPNKFSQRLFVNMKLQDFCTKNLVYGFN